MSIEAMAAERVAPTATSAVTVTGTSTTEAVVPGNNAAKRFVRFANCDDTEIIYVKFGATGLAVASATDGVPIMPLSAEEFVVDPGTYYRAIATTSAPLLIHVTSR